jgi:hypothetical protein
MLFCWISKDKQSCMFLLSTMEARGTAPGSPRFSVFTTVADGCISNRLLSLQNPFLDNLKQSSSDTAVDSELTTIWPTARRRADLIVLGSGICSTVRVQIITTTGICRLRLQPRCIQHIINLSAYAINNSWNSLPCLIPESR